VISIFISMAVIPANAGIHEYVKLDSGLRRNDKIKK